MDEASKDGFARQGRREVLAALALALGGAVGGHAAEVQGGLPWIPEQTQPPEPVSPGGWRYFTADEAATVEALVDRLIPPDPEFPGGKDAGCAVFIDRQLAGPYGVAEGSTRQVHSMMEPKSKGRSRRSIRGITIASHWRRSTSIAARAKAANGSSNLVMRTRTRSLPGWRMARSILEMRRAASSSSC